MLVINKEELKKAFETKPYPISVTERVYQTFPINVKELGWVFNLYSRTFTHYFNNVNEFIHFALMIYGEVRVL